MNSMPARSHAAAMRTQPSTVSVPLAACTCTAQRLPSVSTAAWRLWAAPTADLTTTLPWWRLFAGGLLVGYGARRSNGCTSGHGICGLASFQLPSLTAVLIFVATGMVTAQLAFRIWKQ